ncbi:MAG TPA: TetR-like C-terminal domain-containing protein [Jatrophihabitantaceae bacterium]|nr:TetR-like C-terminal domain-containing protein [Jatrophihabitantaceae bacterium]
MGLTPEIVVATAARLADSDSDGLDAVSLSVLASTLGVRVPSLYKHIGGLDDLHRRMAAAGMASLAAALQRAADGRQGRDALVSIAQAYRRFARLHAGQYQALIRVSGPGAEHAEDARRIVDLLTVVAAQYKLKGDDAVHAVRGIRAALHGFVALEVAGGFGDSESVEASFYSMVAMIDRGLGGWTQPGKSRSGLLGALLRPLS